MFGSVCEACDAANRAEGLVDGGCRADCPNAGRSDEEFIAAMGEFNPEIHSALSLRHDAFGEKPPDGR